MLTKIAKAKSAQQIYSTFSQTQVDYIFKCAAMNAYSLAAPLARRAFEETQMGKLQDKTKKNILASKIFYETFEHEKTCDVIYDNRLSGIRKIAHPMGVIAGIIPCTNPTSTAIYKALMAIKTRNALVVSPHPRAKQCTTDAIHIVNEAAISAGAPKGLLSVLDDISIESTNALIQHPDISMILATGGPAMVKSCYSSGHPAIGVGAGNTPVIIEKTANIRNAVEDILYSKTFDNGVLCTSEQCVYVENEIYANVLEEFKLQHSYVTTEEETEKIRKIVLVDGNKLNPEIVGRTPQDIAKLAGFTVPYTTKLILCEVNNQDVGSNEPLSYEKLCPILSIYRVDNFTTAVYLAKKQVNFGGRGHTAALHTDTNNLEKIQELQKNIPVCRLIINQPSTQGALGYTYNRKWPISLMMGCGTWGGTSYSGNIVPSLLLNITTVIEPRKVN
jgi:acetaldehyde dehydrogenase/alcohol dehydrogenase